MRNLNIDKKDEDDDYDTDILGILALQMKGMFLIFY